jgi:lipoprotein-releasing system ATP-binding protein
LASLLECRGLGKVFTRAGDDLVILDNCDFALAESERVAIMGASGAGKSTLLNLLSGLDVPSAGDILFRDRSLGGAKPAAWSRWRRDTVGFVFQFHFLLPDFTSLENVLLPVRLAGTVTPAQERRAKSLLERMGLADRMHHLPGELSGGEEQRVAVARAFMNEPAIVLADEPTGNLDRHLGRELSDILFDLSRENGCGLIVVTHSRELAARADRRLRLEGGRLIPLADSTSA